MSVSNSREGIPLLSNLEAKCDGHRRAGYRNYYSLQVVEYIIHCIPRYFFAYKYTNLLKQMQCSDGKQTEKKQAKELVPTELSYWLAM
jgi:hypothetical protein